MRRRAALVGEIDDDRLRGCSILSEGGESRGKVEGVGGDVKTGGDMVSSSISSSRDTSCVPAMTVTSVKGVDSCSHAAGDASA